MRIWLLPMMWVTGQMMAGVRRLYGIPENTVIYGHRKRINLITDKKAGITRLYFFHLIFLNANSDNNNATGKANIETLSVSSDDRIIVFTAS